MRIHDTNNDPVSQACEEWQPLLVLSAAGGELEPAEQARLGAHLAGCASCSLALEGEREVLALLLGQHSEPDAGLLASCRMSLDDVLDREEERGWFGRAFAMRLPTNWLAPRPAWSAAVLLIVGFTVGAAVPRLLHRPVSQATLG
ncbi:MAG TPA: zf-HC2 domain-containing protein, partial [Candidatus Acidoferrales bacterium]